MHTEGKQKNKEQTPAHGQTMVNTAVCNLVSKFGEAAQSCGGAQSGHQLSTNTQSWRRIGEDNDGDILHQQNWLLTWVCMWSEAEKNLTFHS